MIAIDISTIDELLQFAKALADRHGENTPLWYRGEDNSTLTLVPSIQRSEKRLMKERFLSNDFYIRAKQTLESPPSRNNYAYWIALMQHYGLPTRILDWSRSPLVAVFFATETYREAPDRDACVWVLVPTGLNEQQGFGSFLYGWIIQEIHNILSNPACLRINFHRVLKARDQFVNFRKGKGQDFKNDIKPAV